MGAFSAFLLIVVAVAVDFFWFDVDRKRWGWMKNWSKLHKIMFFSGFIAVTLLIYVGVSLDYL